MQQGDVCWERNLALVGRVREEAIKWKDIGGGGFQPLLQRDGNKADEYVGL